MVKIEKRYKKLEIDFPIPDILSNDIDEFVNALNSGTTMADCYEQNIRSDLNGCDLVLTEEQDLLLRNYYVKGVIYHNNGRKTVSMD